MHLKKDTAIRKLRQQNRAVYDFTCKIDGDVCKQLGDIVRMQTDTAVALEPVYAGRRDGAVYPDRRQA